MPELSNRGPETLALFPLYIQPVLSENAKWLNCEPNIVETWDEAAKPPAQSPQMPLEATPELYACFLILTRYR